MVKTVDVVVGRADLVGGIALSETEHEVIQVPRGATLHAKLLFNYVERSKDRDHFHMELQTSLGDVFADTVVHNHKDRYGIADDQQGFIQTVHTAPNQEGSYDLSFTIKVNTRDGDEKDARSLHGSIPITVV